MNMPPEQLTYTPTQVAAMIPCNERWLRRQLASGRFPGRKIAREWRMTRDDINKALETCAPVKTLSPRQSDRLAPQSRRRVKKLT